MRLHRGATLVLLGACALVLAVGGTTAPTASRIVVHGADSGSHMRLTVSGDRIVVNGYMSAAEPAGCEFTDFRQEAVCPTDDANSIEVVMGPAGDKVEVLDKLPIPLTAYLGNGSDKLIANGEVDTCYPQGARRNRCIGGAGDDVCITGPRNSDCVGGAGDDFCKHSTGSDGCWGGPGDDVCVMGPGKDGCHGDGGNDRLYEGNGTGKLYGGSGSDFCDGEQGVGRSYTCETGPGR